MRSFLGMSKALVFVLVSIGVMLACEVNAAINVTFCGGGAPCTTGTVTTAVGTVPIVGSYITPSGPVMTVANNTVADLARVGVDDSGVNDKLNLTGATITFDRVVTDYLIEITATGFLQPPDLSGAISPTYRIQAVTQSFTRGATATPVQASIKAKGYVNSGTNPNNPIGIVPTPADPYLLKIFYAGSGIYFFNGTYNQEQVTGNSAASRDLKIQIWVTTKNVADKLKFSIDGLSLKFIPAGGTESDPTDCDGCGQQPPPPCTKSSMLSTSCATTHSTIKALGCPTCVYDDEQMRKTAKARMFVENNLDNLEQDLARGGGEHLTALTALLDVPETQRSVFCEEASDRYRVQAQQGPVTPEQLVATIQHARESRPISTYKTRDEKQE